MFTIPALLIWMLLGGGSIGPLLFPWPVSVFCIVLGAFVSLQVMRRLRKGEEGLSVCLATGCLFEYSVIGFFACLGLSA